MHRKQGRVPFTEQNLLMENLLGEAADLLKKSKNIVLFTGAGMSQESGIPTFRDKDGLWNRYAPEQFGTVDSLKATALKTPEKVLSFIEENVNVFLKATPNAGHLAIANLAKNGHEVTVLTQNIDDLHERAGSAVVHKLHGDLFTFRCSKCGAIANDMSNYLTELKDKIAAVKEKGQALCAADLASFLPKCSCGALMRPDVVLFGESLPELPWNAAREALVRAHCLVVVGTSAEVYPASTLPKLAFQMEVPIIEINPRPVLKHNAVTIAMRAAEAFTKLASKMGM